MQAAQNHIPRYSHECHRVALNWRMYIYIHSILIYISILYERLNNGDSVFGGMITHCQPLKFGVNRTKGSTEGAGSLESHERVYVVDIGTCWGAHPSTPSTRIYSALLRVFFLGGGAIQNPAS